MGDTQVMEQPGRLEGCDEGAFTALYHAYARTVYNFAIRMLYSPDEAGEVVSDVFLALWTRTRRDAGQPRSVRTWLLALARTEILGRIGSRRPTDDDHGVDLRSLAIHRGKTGPGTSPDAGADEAPVAAVLGDLDHFRIKILSLAYFGGHGISAIADRLDLTASECILRLHESLSLLATQGTGRVATAHEVAFAGYTGAYALGVLDGEDRGEFEIHLNEGCPKCEAEIRRLSDASHTLPLLLPDVELPQDLLEKILFSLRLALVVGSGGGSREPGEAGEPGVEAETRAVLPGQRVGPASWLAAAVIAVTAVSGAYVSSLTGIIDEQSNLIEMQQVKAAELLVRYDRLSGISGFLESAGLVAVLSGPAGSRGVSGKILLDTVGDNAMLQLINLPGEFAGKEVEVSALTDSARSRLTGFRLSDGDSGKVIYKFFPAEGKRFAGAGKFTVSISETDDNGRPADRIILEGENTGRP